MPNERSTTTNAPGRDQPAWNGARPAAFLATIAADPALEPVLLELCETLPLRLPPRTLELVALRVSARLDCVYAWHGHARIALAAGLTYPEIASVAGGAPGATQDDAAVLAGVDELLADERLTPASRAALGDEALPVMVATATYVLVAWLMHGAAPEPGVPAIAGLETPARAKRTHAAALEQHEAA